MLKGDNFGTDSGYGQISPYRKTKVQDPEAQATQAAVQGQPQGILPDNEPPATKVPGYQPPVHDLTPSWVRDPDKDARWTGPALPAWPYSDPTGAPVVYSTTDPQYQAYVREYNDAMGRNAWATGGGGTGSAGTGTGTGAITPTAPTASPAPVAAGHPAVASTGATTGVSAGNPYQSVMQALQLGGGGIDAGQSGIILKQVLQQLLNKAAINGALGNVPFTGVR